jgi:hypothetical protein
LVETNDGNTIRIDTIEIVQKQETVYNFKVQDYHSYYVSDIGIWTHNSCKSKGASKSNYRGKVKSGNGKPPANFTPKGGGRRAAFREAKRASGIPKSQQPKSVTPAKDKKGKPVEGGGRDYKFKKGKVIREHFQHSYPDDPKQNRKRHFNDIHGNHYDY